MTLPASGTISLAQVNTELTKASNAVISLNDAAVRGLFGKPSGLISLSDGYGKSNAKLQFDSASNFFLQPIYSGDYISLNFNPDGSITAASIDTPTFNGPRKWLDNIVTGAGKDFEITATLTGNNMDSNVTATMIGQAIDTDTIPPVTAAYQSLETTKSIVVYGMSGQYGRIDGNLTIRRKGTAETISRTFTLIS